MCMSAPRTGGGQLGLSLPPTDKRCLQEPVLWPAGAPGPPPSHWHRQRRHMIKSRNTHIPHCDSLLTNDTLEAPVSPVPPKTFLSGTPAQRRDNHNEHTLTHTHPHTLTCMHTQPDLDEGHGHHDDDGLSTDDAEALILQLKQPKEEFLQTCDCSLC